MKAEKRRLMDEKAAEALELLVKVAIVSIVIGTVGRGSNSNGLSVGLSVG